MGNLPKDLNLYQTSKCNFNCVFCRRLSEGVPEAPDVTSTLVEKIFKKFPISSCCIAGFGEPLMSKGVFDVVSTLNKKGVNPSIITNGSLIVDRFSEIKKANLLYVNVSLNTAVPGKHKGITGTDTEEAVLAGIYKLVSLDRFPVFISMVVLKNNYEDIPAFLERVYSLGAFRTLLLNSLPYNEEAEKKIITEDDIEIIWQIDEFIAFYKGRMAVSRPRYLKASPDHCCDSPWKAIGVDGNGSITGCRRVHGPHIKHGSIEDKDIWDNRYISELRLGVAGKGTYAKYCNRCFGNVR